MPFIKSPSSTFDTLTKRQVLWLLPLSLWGSYLSVSLMVKYLPLWLAITLPLLPFLLPLLPILNKVVRGSTSPLAGDDHEVLPLPTTEASGRGGEDRG